MVESHWLLGGLLMGAAITAAAQPAIPPSQTLPPGSQIVVRERLPVAPESTWVFVQYGTVRTWSELSHWYPFCRFELRGRSEQERHVEPGTYRVTRAVGERRTTRLDHPGATFGTVKVQGGGGAPDIVFRSRFELESTEHPEVERLTCQEKFVMMDTQSGFVSLEQIRKALGDLADVRPVR